MSFSCGDGQNPQLLHDGNSYDFDTPVNVSLETNTCTVSRIAYFATITTQIFDSKGNPGESRTFNTEGIRYVRLPVSIFIRTFPLYNKTAYHLILKHRGLSYQGCSPVDVETILLGGSGFAAVFGSAFLTLEEGLKNYKIKIQDENGNPLLEIPTNNPEYNLSCQGEPEIKCPESTLDCGEGDCCSCEAILNGIRSIRELIK